MHMTEHTSPQAFDDEILKYEKIANEIAARWAKGYIENYDVTDVYEEAQAWVKDLVAKGKMKLGYAREFYPDIYVMFEFGLCLPNSNKIYFIHTQWWADGNISHGLQGIELYT